MQEELQETHRTVLSQFCKREEVQDVVSLVSKKVNWTDYQSLLGKVTELRTYIDHTAESIFLGQRDALQQEFARKADATAVDMALKAKADFREINDLRARLERLEMLFTGLGAHQNARFDELREDITSSFFSKVSALEGQLKEQEDFKKNLENQFAANSKERDEIRASVRGVSSRLDTMLEKLPSTGEALSKVDRQAKETESLLNNIRKEKFAETERIKQLQERFLVIEEKFDKQTDDMHKSTARSDEQIAFLTEASEQLKRRVREVARNMSDQHKSLALEKDQLEARLMRVVMDSGALPEKVDELSRRIETFSIRDRESPAELTAATPEVPVVELLRQMVQDAMPEDKDAAPSATGTPRYALPVPLVPRSGMKSPPAGTFGDHKQLGTLGISPRVVRPPKPR
jgi:chromosome segregation ATPase